ncbi:hypothetical protein H0H92_011866 [Tricholoma furcatifolium]|nr:hypothetical protein H0H92_011866 [Tricholoma furcatifolium]
MAPPFVPNTHITIPPPTAELSTSWKFLEEGVDHIMNKLETGVSYSKYMALYSASYNYCTSSRTCVGSNGLGIGNRSGSHLAAMDLYKRLSLYLANHVTATREQIPTSVDGEELLRIYVAQWKRYTMGAKYTNRLFAYLNKHWVVKERIEGRKDSLLVNTLALAHWNTNLCAHLQRKGQNKLTNAVLRLIQDHRDGDLVDLSVVKNVVDSFVSLGLDLAHPDDLCLDEYKQHFEVPFIAATEEYYKRESQTYLAEHDVSEYMKKAEMRLQEEERRVKRYLNAETHAILMEKCEDILIREHAPRLVEHFQQLLELDRYYDLQRMYSLLSRIPDGSTPLYNAFEEFVKNSGLAAVRQIVGESDDASEVDPRVYIDTLLEVHEKSVATVARCFKAKTKGEEGEEELKSETAFRAAVDKAFQKIVNRNAATGQSDSKSPELLAKYLDTLLRQKGVQDTEFEKAFDRATLLVTFIYDKDVFIAFYQRRLCKRLIYGVFTSYESEESMIGRLRQVLGHDPVDKLKRLIAASKISEEFSEKFKRHTKISNFNAVVIDQGLWPSVQMPKSFTIPTELAYTCETYTGLYRNQHPGRQLIWMWNYSRNELKTNYLAQEYIMMTSTYQAAVLLQYNKHDTLSLHELHIATSIPKEDLTPILAVLVKAKVLVNEEEEQYDLNPGFKAKKMRVNLNIPVRAETKAESKQVKATVEEFRPYMLLGKVVRILKSRKTIKHQALIQEVIELLANQFQPTVPNIKKAIDEALTKEYMERVDGTTDVYSYIA